MMHALPQNIPRNLFIELTTECNYKCKFCHLWTTKELPNSLTTNEKLQLLREFKSINPLGEVIFTGGETMLKEIEFFSLTNECRRLELHCSCNTNASFISSSTIDRLFCEGPNSIVISLDSHLDKIHDFGRGVKGSFNHVTNVIRELTNFKHNKYKNADVQILTNSIIFKENIGFLKEYIAFAETLNLDGITFQILNPTFWNMKQIDHFFTKHFFSDKDQAKGYIDEIIHSISKHPIVLTTKTDFEWMKLYIDNPGLITEQICDSHEKNIMINCYGDVQLCFHMKSILGGNSLGNIRGNSLRYYWYSSEAAFARDIMSTCRKNCGILNCHRKDNSQYI